MKYAQQVLNDKIISLNSEREFGEVQSRIDELVKAVRILMCGQGFLTKDPPIRIVFYDDHAREQ